MEKRLSLGDDGAAAVANSPAASISDKAFSSFKLAATNWSQMAQELEIALERAQRQQQEEHHHLHHHQQQQQEELHNYQMYPNSNSNSSHQLHFQTHLQPTTTAEGMNIKAFSALELTLVALLILLILISIVGNCLVVVAICTDRRLRKWGNVFIVSLAIADLFVSCLVMTFALCNDLMDYWIFGERFCDVWISFDIMCCTASILNLCAISLDRFIHIKDCLLYNQWMTKRVAIGAVAGIWFISALVSFVPINLGWHKPPVSHFAATAMASSTGRGATATDLASSATGLSIAATLNSQMQRRSSSSLDAAIDHDELANLPNLLQADHSSDLPIKTIAATLTATETPSPPPSPKAQQSQSLLPHLPQPPLSQSKDGANQVERSQLHRGDPESMRSKLNYMANKADGQLAATAAHWRLPAYSNGGSGGPQSEGQIENHLLPNDHEQGQRGGAPPLSAGWAMQRNGHLAGEGKKLPDAGRRPTKDDLIPRGRRASAMETVTEAQTAPTATASTTTTTTTVTATTREGSSGGHKLLNGGGGARRQSEQSNSEASAREDTTTAAAAAALTAALVEGPLKVARSQLDQVEFNPLAPVVGPLPGSLQAETAKEATRRRRQMMDEEETGGTGSSLANSTTLASDLLVSEQEGGKNTYSDINGQTDYIAGPTTHQNQANSADHSGSNNYIEQTDQRQQQPPTQESQPQQQLRPQCMLTLTPTYAVVSSTISFYIPCIIMLGLYSKLFACARRHVRNIRAISKAPQPILSANPSTCNRRGPAVESSEVSSSYFATTSQALQARTSTPLSSSATIATAASHSSNSTPSLMAGAYSAVAGRIGRRRNQAAAASEQQKPTGWSRSDLRPTGRTWIKFGLRPARRADPSETMANNNNHSNDESATNQQQQQQWNNDKQANAATELDDQLEQVAVPEMDRPCDSEAAQEAGEEEPFLSARAQEDEQEGRGSVNNNSNSNSNSNGNNSNNSNNNNNNREGPNQVQFLHSLSGDSPKAQAGGEASVGLQNNQSGAKNSACRVSFEENQNTKLTKSGDSSSSFTSRRLPLAASKKKTTKQSVMPATVKFNMSKQQQQQYQQQQQHQQQQQQQQQQQTSQLATHKAAVTLGIIMGTFLVCWVPFFCLNIIKAFWEDFIPSSVFRAFTWLGYANSALNPIIYGIHNSEFRCAFNRIFFKHLSIKNSRQYLNRRFSYDLRHNQNQYQQQRRQVVAPASAAPLTECTPSHNLSHNNNLNLNHTPQAEQKNHSTKITTPTRQHQQQKLPPPPPPPASPATVRLDSPSKRHQAHDDC